MTRTPIEDTTQDVVVAGVPAVSDVLLVFSTTAQPPTDQALRVPEGLMTNDPSLSAARVAELYNVRWQIKRFSKELKSTLGFHRDRWPC